MNSRILINETGEVAIVSDDGRMLFLNFGDYERALEFLKQRLAQGVPDMHIDSFEVPASVLDELRAAAVPEQFSRRFPDCPIMVDETKAADQFGLRRQQIELLRENIIPGSGRVEYPR